MAGGSIFTRIIAGEIPCHRVYEDEHVIAFLDINPLAAGHTLVVPRREVERLEDLRQDEVDALFRAVQGLAPRLLAATGASAYNVLQNNGKASGQEIMHVHVHIIPRAPGDGLGFRWNARPADPATLAELAQKVRAS